MNTELSYKEPEGPGTLKKKLISPLALVFLQLHDTYTVDTDAVDCRIAGVLLPK